MVCMPKFKRQFNWLLMKIVLVFEPKFLRLCWTKNHFLYENMRKKLIFIHNKSSYKDFTLNFRGDTVSDLKIITDEVAS